MAYGVFKCNTVVCGLRSQRVTTCVVLLLWWCLLLLAVSTTSGGPAKCQYGLLQHGLLWCLWFDFAQTLGVWRRPKGWVQAPLTGRLAKRKTKVRPPPPSSKPHTHTQTHIHTQKWQKHNHNRYCNSAEQSSYSLTRVKLSQITHSKMFDWRNCGVSRIICVYATRWGHLLVLCVGVDWPWSTVTTMLYPPILWTRIIYSGRARHFPSRCHINKVAK